MTHPRDIGLQAARHDPMAGNVFAMHVNYGNDPNGNNRRCYVIVKCTEAGYDGPILDVVWEGHTGKQALTDWLDAHPRSHLMGISPTIDAKINMLERFHNTIGVGA